MFENRKNSERKDSVNLKAPFRVPIAIGIAGRQFLSFVRKEFHHIFRDKRTMFILLGMPVVQIIIFGFALTNEVKNSSIAVLDQSKDAATSSLITEIGSSRYFNIN